MCSEVVIYYMLFDFFDFLPMITSLPVLKLIIVATLKHSVSLTSAPQPLKVLLCFMADT